MDCRITATLLIPDPMDSKFSYALELVNWIWDQSLMTVEINTITRVLRPASQMSCKGRRHDYPRSIVTDHYLLDSITASVPYGLTKWEEGPANNLWPIGLCRS